ncbi:MULTISPECIES: NADH:ubiquinone oxidoreductase subunit NDUFA12 [Edaphosphingomonas]|uniref:NADH:ubiquinone oxidoreductase subunit NDUFA12 n=2 Tax=Edaphosphingomonas TaxID=3423724 RepID=A0A2T4HMV7_9SPHN|nr:MULTISPECIES: NADH:ubiquinone oxidoreductase subunit NDUFA12 [Sphingomonas]MDX3883958.1 NADH:ubiquinone oxidoreductase subunit NDUFA12 [Sphingomonas sp.]OHT19832.1 NADH dehydrogenase [Sphingomonas haloaromaticamans]PTD17096.1 NADH:ubiquinone oxidoreductase subunit NDUFA12 [Sphingomonas fennica]
MGLLKSIFTWWDGATIGTSLWSRRNGTRIGEDALGNVYYESRAGKSPRRRWVIYNGSNDASRVPAEWHGWLHQTIEEAPDKALPPARAWQQPSRPNATGTALAYRPPGALEKGGHRAAATGDYEAWSPN